MTARTDDFMKLTFVSGRTRAMVGKDHVAFTDTGGRFAWSVATYVDFHEFNRNGVVDRYVMEHLSYQEAMSLLRRMEGKK